MKKVSGSKVVTTREASQLALPAEIQEALGELVGAAREGLLALTWIIGSGVVHQVGPVGRWAWVVRGCSAGFARGRLTLAGVVW